MDVKETEERISIVPGISLTTAALGQELASPEAMQCWSQQPFGTDGTIRVCTGQDSLWVLLRRPGSGGFVLRTAYSPGGPLQVETTTSGQDTDTTTYHVKCAMGSFAVELRIMGDEVHPVLRSTVRLTPAQDLLLPFWPRDLYPLGGERQDDPAQAKGEVFAAQRGLNAGLLYLTLTEPSFGRLLYLQNLTALNDYFRVTETTPESAVGAAWPEMGYQMPVSTTKALPAGKEVVLSDVVLTYDTGNAQKNVRDDARLFLELLAAAYRVIERPKTEYHDWPRLAEKTLRDLQKSPDATQSHYGHTYLHPYTNFEYADSMAQMSVLTSIKEYGSWLNKETPFTDELFAGMPRFFDNKLSTIRRYLPNVGDDKNADEVDAWYMYHPLINLARLALQHDNQKARELFLAGLEFGIKAARHFKYVWPITYDINTLNVFHEVRTPGEPGQSDVGGIYAYVCLLAWDLTGEERYLDEAKEAINALKHRRFDLEYQANITAWGATACMRLWRISGDDFYRDQSFVFLANLFHNTVIWDSQIKNAPHYHLFMGETCLRYVSYLAPYEGFETYAAVQEYLQYVESDLPQSVLLLLTEYAKYALTRGWYYYPEHLPKEALATEVWRGHIDPHLAFPLEDLYPDGEPAGQVGQEIYGCGAAFVYATRAYHRRDTVPFLLYSEYPVAKYELSTETEAAEKREAQLRLFGADNFAARVRLIPSGRKELPEVRVTVVRESGAEEKLSIRPTTEGHIEFDAPADETLSVYW